MFAYSLAMSPSKNHEGAQRHYARIAAIDEEYSVLNGLVAMPQSSPGYHDWESGSPTGHSLNSFGSPYQYLERPPHAPSRYGNRPRRPRNGDVLETANQSFVSAPEPRTFRRANSMSVVVKRPTNNWASITSKLPKDGPPVYFTTVGTPGRQFYTSGSTATLDDHTTETTASGLGSASLMKGSEHDFDSFGSSDEDAPFLPKGFRPVHEPACKEMHSGENIIFHTGPGMQTIQLPQKPRSSTLNPTSPSFQPASWSTTSSAGAVPSLQLVQKTSPADIYGTKELEPRRLAALNALKGTMSVETTNVGQTMSLDNYLVDPEEKERQLSFARYKAASAKVQSGIAPVQSLWPTSMGSASDSIYIGSRISDCEGDVEYGLDHALDNGGNNRRGVHPGMDVLYQSTTAAFGPAMTDYVSNVSMEGGSTSGSMSNLAALPHSMRLGLGRQVTMSMASTIADGETNIPDRKPRKHGLKSFGAEINNTYHQTMAAKGFNSQRTRAATTNIWDIPSTHETEQTHHDMETLYMPTGSDNITSKSSSRYGTSCFSGLADEELMVVQNNAIATGRSIEPQDTSAVPATMKLPPWLRSSVPQKPTQVGTQEESEFPAARFYVATQLGDNSYGVMETGEVVEEAPTSDPFVDSGVVQAMKDCTPMKSHHASDQVVQMPGIWNSSTATESDNRRKVLDPYANLRGADSETPSDLLDHVNKLSDNGLSFVPSQGIYDSSVKATWLHPIGSPHGVTTHELPDLKHSQTMVKPIGYGRPVPQPTLKIVPESLPKEMSPPKVKFLQEETSMPPTQSEVPPVQPKNEAVVRKRLGPMGRPKTQSKILSWGSGAGAALL